MLRSLLTLLICLAASNAVFSAPLKVVTWNIEWLPGGHPDATDAEKAAQMKTAQAIVKALDPDILLCQEVFDWKTAAELCSVVPGLKVCVTSNYGPRPQNEEIATKLPVDSCWYAPWKPTYGPNDPPRGYAFAAIQLPTGGLLLTYAVHLKSNLGGIPATIRDREDAAKQLLAHVKDMQALYGKRTKCDVLIGGDMNTSLSDPAFKDDHSLRSIMAAGFHWGFEGVPADKRVTMPGKGQFPPGTFDHFFTLGFKLDSVAAGSSGGASDHNPVIGTFTP
jgi:endonuclease/exonuclease/phosphatase family metal-dependent hydrolase